MKRPSELIEYFEILYMHQLHFSFSNEVRKSGFSGVHLSFWLKTDPSYLRHLESCAVFKRPWPWAIFLHTAITQIINCELHSVSQVALPKYCKKPFKSNIFLWFSFSILISKKLTITIKQVARRPVHQLCAGCINVINFGFKEALF